MTNQLPDSWRLTTLGEVSVEKVPQLQPSGRSTFTYVDISSIDNRTKTVVDAKLLPCSAAPSRARQSLQVGDVVVSMTRPNLNAVARITEVLDGAIGSTGFHVLRTPWINPDWVYFLVQTQDFIDAMCLRVQGALYPAVRPKDVGAYHIPLAPRSEQDRIVEEIEKQFTRLDAGVAALKRVEANLKRYKAAVLKAACEGKLTEKWRQEHPDVEPASELLKRILKERRRRWEEAELARMLAKGKPPTDDRWKKKYKEPTAFDTSDLPHLPDGWCWVSLAHLASFDGKSAKTGPFGTLLKKHEHQSTGVPVLGIENIDRMQFIYGSKIHIAKEKATQLAEYDALPGDVLISRSGTVGEVCVVPDDIGVARISTNLMRVRLNRSVMTPQFFCILFNGSPVVLQQVADLCAGSTRDFLNHHILASLRFPLPPVTEQNAICTRVEECLTSLAAASDAATVARRRGSRLRQSILKRAFEGKLVPQDPTDLPASRPGTWFVYALECDDRSIYIGQTQDIEKRWQEHASGKGAEWTRKHPPVRLVHWEEFNSLDAAVKREKELKTGFGRKWLKRELAAGRTRQAGEPASVLLDRIRTEQAKTRGEAASQRSRSGPRRRRLKHVVK